FLVVAALLPRAAQHAGDSGHHRRAGLSGDGDVHRVGAAALCILPAALPAAIHRHRSLDRRHPDAQLHQGSDPARRRGGARRRIDLLSVIANAVDNFDTQLSQTGAILRAALKKERRNWKLPEPLRAQPGLEAFSHVFRQILHGRGVVRQSQLDPWLQTDLEGAPDPFLLKDMAVACDLIAQSIAAGDRIAVYGDYDADGVTACVTLARGLRSVGAEVITYI